MRVFSVIAVALALLVALPPAKAQTYDQATVEAHLREMYKDHGAHLQVWKRPVYYIVAGLHDTEKRLVADYFAYVAALTGLQIQEADPAESKGNFILIFADPIFQIAGLKTLRPIFGNERQSDADYRSMLERLERDRTTKFVTRRSEDENAILFVAVLANPTHWNGELIDTLFLRLILDGITKTRSSSNEISPSVWNDSSHWQPRTRLPSFDEALLRALYRKSSKSGLPIDEAISILADEIVSELDN